MGSNKTYEKELAFQADRRKATVEFTVWRDYNIAEDVGYWVKMFISMAETFPACIVISDMTIPGNPMFYVNDEFCKTTEYSKDEAQGRNCPPKYN